MELWNIVACLLIRGRQCTLCTGVCIILTVTDTELKHIYNFMAVTNCRAQLKYYYEFGNSEDFKSGNFHMLLLLANFCQNKGMVPI